jgi:hypothetical protein
MANTVEVARQARIALLALAVADPGVIGKVAEGFALVLEASLTENEITGGPCGETDRMFDNGFDKIVNSIQETRAWVAAQRAADEARLA